MTTLPLAVLVHEGTTARSYLRAMIDVGVRPAVVVRLLYTRDFGNGRPVAPMLPGRVRRWYLARAQELALNHWPRWLLAQHPELVLAIADAAGPLCGWPVGYPRSLVETFSYRDCADRLIDLPVSGIDDRAVPACLREIGLPVLFTGGGLLPRATVESVTFIHIHPGRLPDVKGADGFLWSLLLQGHASATCFLMRADIDSGPLLLSRDFGPLSIGLDSSQPRPDDLTLYRAIFSFLDPVFRAALWRDVVQSFAAEGVDVVLSRATPTTSGPAHVYHFMSDRLRREALRVVFQDRDGDAG